MGSSFRAGIAAVALVVTAVLHTVLVAALWVLAWIVVPIAAGLKQYGTRYMPRFGRASLQWKSSWMWVWGNEEDGIDGMKPWDWGWINPWFTKTKDWSEFHRIVHWTCWRNPMGNLRFVKPFGFLIQPERVGFVGNSMHPRNDNYRAPGTYWYLAWHGVYTGFWIITRGFQFRIGWRILPEDVSGVDADDFRSKGCGFTLQFGKANYDPNVGSPLI